ncbi:related to oxidoreductase [Fusarium fujikuroi IMI 58289]|uniref:Related to oxidoreductase n=1 Tax=Gibberella fujikuroi (strain CBS 195.34 / IMI 58289 / NRRL A-6831) TaxID=1279085 RepID=S0DI45_GIBF5|nr:related to oxidoreductase [Fusarium fujikuroi IMI 58289]KLO86641.1 oxidoreductase [Fusarium fujikuroi]KLP16319.1 oxidoreductase [Fusarium fujikuroi]CCT61716.1 related to oxidoreductase [Fusarium fujikuroi IMI 58289]SCO12196.1 related to oxidoreductase [Fusarium fujikuroi]SCO27426.1 related to oxidoreductase [Fusarium fujikuroi]
MSPHSASTTTNDLVNEYADVIKGKTILTTGVTPNSLGATFILETTSKSPSLLILAGRNASKLQEMSEAITKANPSVKTRSLVVDLGSLASVRKAAEEVNSWNDVPSIDVVVNNAGVMAIPYTKSVDGYEMQFAICHLGHFLLTNLIMDKILASESPRVVNISSNGHSLGPIRFADPHFSDGELYDQWSAYGQSKTANMLFSVSLAQKLGSRGLQSYSVHPGLILSTGLGTHLDFASMDADLGTFIKSHRARGNSEGWTAIPPVPVEVGAATHAFAAFDPNIKASNGAYLLEARVADPFVDTVKAWARDAVEAEKLWRLSEELVGQKFGY